MKTTKLLVILLTLFAVGTVVGCSRFSAKSPDVSDNVRKSLDQAGLKDVSVSQDRDKGIVTLGGQVASEDQKTQAESLAKSLAGRTGRRGPDCRDPCRFRKRSKSHEL